MPLVDPRAQGDPVNAMLAALVGALEAHRVPYTFTGSFSLGFWAQPRSSKDIDVVVLLDDPLPEPLERADRVENFEVAYGDRRHAPTISHLHALPQGPSGAPQSMASPGLRV